MQTAEYNNLDSVERGHWYYSGKRHIVEYWINSHKIPQSTDTLLDFGAGTGYFASTFLGRCKVLVADSYPESLEILRNRFPAECVIEPTGSTIPVSSASIDYVTALDVLEHLPDDAGAVLELSRVLRPGGLAVVTVPADMKLWSDWDVSLFHHRRYDKQGLMKLFDQENWELIHCTYTNIFAYPAVFLLRKFRKSRPLAATRMEDRVPAPWLNRLLRYLFTAPAKRTWFPAPFGVSLLLVARKR